MPLNQLWFPIENDSLAGLEIPLQEQQHWACTSCEDHGGSLRSCQISDGWGVWGFWKCVFSGDFFNLWEIHWNGWAFGGLEMRLLRRLWEIHRLVGSKSTSKSGTPEKRYEFERSRNELSKNLVKKVVAAFHPQPGLPLQPKKERCKDGTTQCPRAEPRIEILREIRMPRIWQSPNSGPNIQKFDRNWKSLMVQFDRTQL